MPKSVKSVNFDRVIKKLKRGRFLEHSVLQSTAPYSFTYRSGSLLPAILGVLFSFGYLHRGLHNTGIFLFNIILVFLQNVQSRRHLFRCGAVIISRINK